MPRKPLKQRMPTGVPHSQKNALLEDPTVGLCPRHYGGWAFFDGRGTPAHFRHGACGAAGAGRAPCPRAHETRRLPNLLVQVLDLCWSLPESGDFWYTSRRFLKDDLRRHGARGDERVVLHLLSYSRAQSRVIQQSMGLKYKSSPERLHISAEQLFLSWELYPNPQPPTLNFKPQTLTQIPDGNKPSTLNPAPLTLGIKP